jgi:uncharacterized membrane protein SpoIIM required for sporulation
MLESTIIIQPYRRYLLWYITLGLLVTVMLLVRMGARIFNREELLGRSLDQLNLRWAWHIFWSQFRGPVEGRFNLWRWYRQSVFPAIRQLWDAVGITLLCVMAAFITGWILAGRFPVSLEQYKSNDKTLLENLQSWLDFGDKPQLATLVIGQNLRVLFLATLLAIFSFGVMDLIIVMIPFGITGFIMGQVTMSHLSPVPFVLALIPHGIIEVPAILLAGGAALRLGSCVTRPARGMTVGEAWLRALGDTVKIGLAVVLPMIILAGILEVVVTPRVVELVLKL